MMYNQSSEKVEWGHMQMPEIIIDSDNESTTKNYENESFNNRFLKAQREESNHLFCKSNLDDVDSGIHESNDIYLPGLTSVIHSNRLSLREMKKRSNLTEVRSYSTNCITTECNKFKDGVGIIIDPSLCRNCSTKTNSKKHSDTSRKELNESQYSMKENIKLPEINPKINNSDSLQHRLCRIRVLLVCMKILLGSTMTGLGLFLLSISESIKVKDCAFWASGPLLLSGLFEVFMYNWRNKLKKPIKICILMTTACGVISCICSILCLLSSVFSGIHGNWISGHNANCADDENSLVACCFTEKLRGIDSCLCQEARTRKEANSTITMTYYGFTCRYLFSAVKDYLILQCALMGIGSGVCLWVLQMSIQRLLQDCGIAHRTRSNHESTDDQNCIEQSPVIPLKIRCIQDNEKSQIFNDFLREKSINNQINYQERKTNREI